MSRPLPGLLDWAVAQAERSEHIALVWEQAARRQPGSATVRRRNADRWAAIAVEHRRHLSTLLAVKAAVVWEIAEIRGTERIVAAVKNAADAA